MKKILFMIIAVVAIAVSGCKKEGCVDVDATNYCDECKKDDGSCIYKGDYVIWVKTGDIDPSAGESINVYMENVYQGNIAVTFSSVPNCGNTGALTISKDLGTSKSKGFSTTFKGVDSGVEDTDPANWIVRTSTFAANTCTSYQIQ